VVVTVRSVAMQTQSITIKGQSWRRTTYAPELTYCMAVDLGQSQDYTAISVCRFTRTPLDSHTVNHQTRNTTQNLDDKFDIVHLERLALGTPYPNVVAYVKELLQRRPLDQGCSLVIDDGGVGRAVGDLFEAAGLRLERVVITAGFDVTREKQRWHVPKTELIAALDAGLHTGELRFAEDLLASEALRAELIDFRRSVTAAGRATYAARVGRHDDLILAVSLAMWWSRERLKHRITWSVC